MIDYPDLRSPRLSSFRSSEGVASSQHSVVPPSRNSKMDVYKSVDALNLKMLKELDREPDGVYSNKLDYKIVSKSWKDKLLLKQAEFEENLRSVERDFSNRIAKQGAKCMFESHLKQKLRK